MCMYVNIYKMYMLYNMYMYMYIPDFLLLGSLLPDSALSKTVLDVGVRVCDCKKKIEMGIPYMHTHIHTHVCTCTCNTQTMRLTKQYNKTQHNATCHDSQKK